MVHGRNSANRSFIGTGKYIGTPLDIEYKAGVIYTLLKRAKSEDKIRDLRTELYNYLKGVEKANPSLAEKLRKKYPFDGGLEKE